MFGRSQIRFPSRARYPETEMFDLTPKQSEVLAALLTGATMTEAAALAGIHRNTLGHWRASSLPFRYALNNALYDKALLFREQAEKLIDVAYQQLEQLLADPKTPPSIRFKAIQYIIEKATTPPPPKPDVSLDIEKIRYTQGEPLHHPPQNDAPQKTHNSAQPTGQSAAPETSPEMHNSAHSVPPHRPGTQPGRNEPCPCGSGQKFKRCCLGKASAQAA